MNDLVGGMGKMSFEDLSVQKHLEKITLELPHQHTGTLRLEQLGLGVYERYSAPKKWMSDDELANILSQLASNTHANEIEVTLCSGEWTEAKDRVINALYNIEAGEMKIYRNTYSGYTNKSPQVNFSTLLSIAQKVRKVYIAGGGSSLTVQDLCAFRKVMIEGGCKLESFKIGLSQCGMTDAFVKECFGVTEERSVDPLNDYKYNTIFRASDESIEMYVTAVEDSAQFYLHHFEGDLRTTVGFSNVVFEKCKGGAKPDGECEKMKMNHLYEHDDIEPYNADDDY